MKTFTIRACFMSILLLFAAMTACSRDNTNEAVVAEAEPTPAESIEPLESQPGADADLQSELSGTKWRLVKIASMDDTVDVPDDSNKYTLEFGTDGSVSMQADCNRGMGNWTSESPGQLTFGPIAATRAMCPPESLGEKYVAQFEWVRSYVLKNGHLFLATMADGSIIEFEPMDAGESHATVLGEEIDSSNADEVQQIIITRLFDHYAEQNGYVATDEEVKMYVSSLERGMVAEGLGGTEELTAEEAAQIDEMRQDMGSSIIQQWKINRALYEQYGGRIIYQQMGPEPLDAYHQYFEERQAAGDFEIHDPAMSDAFWSYFTDESRHDFMEPGGEDEARAFSTPPWEALDSIESR